MLTYATGARTAYRFAPNQHRRSMASVEMKSKYFSTIFHWSDGSEIGYPLDTAVLYMGEDTNWNRNYNLVNTQVITQHPIATMNQGIKCWQFDGVNDHLPSTNTFGVVPNFGATTEGAAVTIFSLRKLSGAVSGLINERTTNYTTSTEGWGVYGHGTLAGASLRGNVGTSTREWTTSQTNWTMNTVILNKEASLGNEILAYENGVQVTVFSASANADNTNDFGALQRMSMGGRIGGTVSMNGYLAQLVIFARPLSAAEITRATQLIRWRAGFTA